MVSMAFYKDLKEKGARKCLMCEGDIEKANTSNICNVCKDKFRK